MQEETGIDRRELIKFAGKHVLFPFMLQALLDENNQHAARIGREIAVIDPSHGLSLNRPFEQQGTPIPP
jgi:hypothetical protein